MHAPINFWGKFSSEMRYQKIYVLGAGAVGCYFGGMLARAGHDVTLITRSDRAQAINAHGLQMDCQTFQETVSVKASSDVGLLADADLLLVSVKSPDTEKTIQEISPILPHHAVILSLQNGVANVEIAARFLPNPIYPAVVYVASGMTDARTMSHHGRGELLVGSLQSRPQDAENLALLCELFSAASVPCIVADNIWREMWLKFLVNCSYNAISGIGQIAYGQMVQIPEIYQLIAEITQEFLTVAPFAGVYIAPEEARQANVLIANSMATQRSSTAQDLAKGKKTEIEFLNGYIVELGKRYGVPTQANQAVFALVKMLETSPRAI